MQEQGCKFHPYYLKAMMNLLLKSHSLSLLQDFQGKVYCLLTPTFWLTLFEKVLLFSSHCGCLILWKMSSHLFPWIRNFSIVYTFNLGVRKLTSGIFWDFFSTKKVCQWFLRDKYNINCLQLANKLLAEFCAMINFQSEQ